MNKAARKIHRTRLINHLSALVSWRSELTTEIFEAATHERLLRQKRNEIDTAISFTTMELTIHLEVPNVENVRTEHGTGNDK